MYKLNTDNRTEFLNKVEASTGIRCQCLIYSPFYYIYIYIYVCICVVQEWDDQHEHTYSNYVRTQDVTLKTCRRR